MTNPPCLSTDQLAAFVELARQGSLRAAAQSLHITEQGVRNRLIALERRLSVELYYKRRGMRRTTPLTDHGRRFLPEAMAFLDRASQLADLFDRTPPRKEVTVVASQYLIAYLLIVAVKQFHAAHPDIRVRLSARREREIEQALLEDPDVSLGVAAPYEPSNELHYIHLFSMGWSLLTPRGHRLLKRKRLRLCALADEPLIFYERGSTGRQHVMNAFQRQGVEPRVEMEATNTDLIVRMVEAGLGVAIVPLLPSGEVTRGHRVAAISLGEQVRPIEAGILARKDQPIPDAADRFVRFVREQRLPKDVRS